MQVPFFIICYTAANVSNPTGRIATGFPLRAASRSCINTIPRPGLTLKTVNFPQNPRNITFYILKPRPTITIAPSPTHGVVGRVTPCAPLLASRPTSYPGCHFPIAFLNTFKKHIMQVPVFTTCYVRIQSAQDAGRVATGFPLPQRGEGLRVRGGHIQSRPPSVSSCISTTRGPGLKLNT